MPKSTQRTPSPQSVVLHRFTHHLPANYGGQINQPALRTRGLGDRNSRVYPVHRLKRLKYWPRDDPNEITVADVG